MSVSSLFRVAVATALFSTGMLFCCGSAESQDKTTVEICFANDTGEDIFFFVNGKHGSTAKIELKKNEVIGILFYDDMNQRACVAYDIQGKSVLSYFSFVPGSYCVLIEKNQRALRSVDLEKRKPTVARAAGVY